MKIGWLGLGLCLLAQPGSSKDNPTAECSWLYDRIAALEDEQGAVQARLNDSATYKDAPQEIPALNSRLQALEGEIEAAMLRWEALESRSGKK